MIAPPREIEDALKEALKEFTAIEPVYTGSAMPQADMEKFIQQWWFMDEAGIRRHERASHMVFCRACMEPGGTKAFTVRAYRMAVDFEISPLDHSMILAHTACLHCGESMVYAVNKQDLWNTGHPSWIHLMNQQLQSAQSAQNAANTNQNHAGQAGALQGLSYPANPAPQGVLGKVLGLWKQ